MVIVDIPVSVDIQVIHLSVVILVSPVIQEYLGIQVSVDSVGIPVSVASLDIVGYLVLVDIQEYLGILDFQVIRVKMGHLVDPGILGNQDLVAIQEQVDGQEFLAGPADQVGQDILAKDNLDTQV